MQEASDGCSCDLLIEGGCCICEQAKKMVVQLLVDRPRVVLVDDCKNGRSKVVVLQTCFMAKHTYLANGDQQGHAHLQGASCAVLPAVSAPSSTVWLHVSCMRYV